MLAAEKAGCWSDALALYEQALQNEAPVRDTNPDPNPAPAAAGPEAQALPGGGSDAGLSAAQRGHLHCLLQMGHLQGMLAQVDGWVARSTGAAHHAMACKPPSRAGGLAAHHSRLQSLQQVGHLQACWRRSNGYPQHSSVAHLFWVLYGRMHPAA